MPLARGKQHAEHKQAGQVGETRELHARIPSLESDQDTPRTTASALPVSQENASMRQLVQSRAGWLAGIAGASAVLLGAFGAHALKDALDTAHQELWHTAVQYHFWHALALAATTLGRTGKARGTALGAFALGIVMFSGSLYALALGAPRWVGIVTPFGGVAFMAGWIALGASLKAQPDSA
jgi:uncharacterized membrane protein YgdD (TMEM256/DUF423 family)